MAIIVSIVIMMTVTTKVIIGDNDNDGDDSEDEGSDGEDGHDKVLR